MRLGDGSCACFVGFTGSRCEECDVGYFGDGCKNCELGYYKDSSLKICIEGDCDQIGNYERTEDGVCKCMTGYQGSKCNMCSTGFTGASCDKCDKGYYMDGNTCKGTQN